MAYLPQDPNDPNKQQPQTGGGVGASPMTQGAQSAPKAAPSSPMQAPQQSAMQGQGSNFVNLSSFLTPTVAKQNADKVSALGSSTLTSEKQTYDKAADPVRNATFSPIQGSAKDIVNKLVPDANPNQPPPGKPPVPPGGYYDPATGIVWGAKQANGTRAEVKGTMGSGSMPDPDAPKQPAPTDDKAANLGLLKSMLTQDYTGPSSVDYDPSKSAGMAKLGLLGNADTAVNAMNPGQFSDNLPSATYGQGNRWLDDSLIKGDAGTMGQIANVKSGTDTFAKGVGDEEKALGTKVEGFKAAAKDARDKARGELTGYGDEMLKGIDTRVKGANAQEGADQGGQVVRDPNTGKVVAVPEGQRVGGWEAGTGANAGNMATDTERGRLGAISSLLGMDKYNVGPKTAYQSGRYTTEAANPGMVAAPAWKSGTDNVANLTQGGDLQGADARTGYYGPSGIQGKQEAEARGLPYDQAVKYMAARKSGATHEQAMKQARGG